ncbi:DUF6588 family protein [uncultured Imperialibacter sp.]|uniref:DUF6588 family protein n=1 Tax=uncultured Imperialibacter sp. TaxID=1672639 RepID=UPI0030D95454|tara:strand:- start:1642 stop:2703 length:1062 start_codon:yes stop_codon:yes gene_type:complete
MKSVFTKVFSCLGLALFIVVLSSKESKAQDFSEVLKAQGDDAEKLLENYIGPFFTGFGVGMANGWYNTAAPHKFPGFDLTVSVNLASVPQDGQVFKFNASDYSSITGVRQNGGAAQSTADVETLFGPGDTESELQLSYQREYQGQTYTVNSAVELPSGFGFPYVPTPVAQLGIGLPKGTDLKLRLMPTIASEDFSISLFGIGVMHDFKQWIPGMKVLPFDASVLIGYTKLSAENSFAGSEITDNGTGEISVSSLTYQILVSKKLSILTVYGGFGANSIKSNLKMLGTYTIEAEASNGASADIELQDPVDLMFKSGGARATIGLRLKLAILTLHGDYTVQKYNTITAGVGFSVR